ncbi:MAG: Hsp70 family protein [Saprospiraceae bacterium]|nr:Hsp70 family protein [Saprospiraceae bacterium]MBP6565710.1 Hsp70 family protein [Saprospiraceae bacterium]
MATDITIDSLFPAVKRQHPSKQQVDIFNTTFIGIDFGTSTTVVSVSHLDIETKDIKTKTLWLNQKQYDGTPMSSEKIPTVIAWYKNQLLVGQGAADLKHHLKQGVNVWYSFKMELGEDLGSKYYNSELDRKSKYTILNPKDATKVFFQYLKAQIDRIIRTENLPENLQYAVSIPASFEANQRKELVQALEQNGMAINKQALIDEPNAAFLSYVQMSNIENNPLKIPDGDNPKVLVFDFGAGTCDVSIIELGKDINGIYSKNLSISKFEKIGGDDLDRFIALEYLFPQLLSENKLTKADFKTPEKNRIITQLLKASEQLKILICDTVAKQTSNKLLPTLAIAKDNVSLGYTIEIDSRKGLLILTEPKLSYLEFSESMKTFLKTNSLIPKKGSEGQNDFISVFSPIHTALKKASLSKSEIDYVLFIGGSCKNPYVQNALKEYFTDSDLLIPSDLQTHVSSGAAIHSLIYNGFNKNIIQPITSEPFLVITKDESAKVILRAGTHIPCDLIIIDDLVTTKDGQQAIELPICLGNKNRLLYNIKIVCDDLSGFKKNTPVRLELEINADKLLLARASAVGKSVFVEAINPFANKDLSTEERIVLKAERQANIEAEQNNGKPTKQGLTNLYKAYELIGNDFRAAETLELLNELYPSISNYNEIGVLYSSAGYYEKALEFYELAFVNDKNSTTAFNFAHSLKSKNKEKFKEILEESLHLEPNMPHSLFELGRLLKREKDEKGNEMIKQAFDIWKKNYDTNSMSESDYSWLSSAADELGMKDFAQQVRQSTPTFKVTELYNSDNLTQTNIEEGLIKQ